MKTVAPLLLALALCLVAPMGAAEAQPRFNAVLTVGNVSHFVLVDAAGNASTYLEIGRTFQGYTLKAYDAATQTLEVQSTRETLRLPLVDAVKIQPTGRIEVFTFDGNGGNPETKRALEKTMAAMDAVIAQLGKPTFVLINGKPHLQFSPTGRPLPVGTRIEVTVESRSMTLQISSADPTSYTVVYDGWVLTRPTATAPTP